MEFNFRTGIIHDIAQLQALGLKAYGQFKKVLTEDNWNKMHLFLSSTETYSHLLDTSTCFVCEMDDKIIGMAFLVPKGNPTDIFDKDWSYIRMVGVDPDYEGKGIGKQLTQMCIDFARETNEKIIALHTSEFMDGARHIYERLGFKKLAEIALRYGKRYWVYKLDL